MSSGPFLLTSRPVLLPGAGQLAPGGPSDRTDTMGQHGDRGGDRPGDAGRTDYILTRYLEIGVADVDVQLVRDHVGAALMYLAQSSLRIG